MAAGARDRPHPAAVVFDLDNALLDRRPAWRYTLEQAVSMVTAERVDARPLAAEYFERPVAHALAILVPDPQARLQCERLWPDIYRRSAMKWLTVHDGIGRALDTLVSAGAMVGAVSAEPHTVARKQVESTGLDRFVTILASTPEGDPWDAHACLADCMAFIDCEPRRCLYVTPDDEDAAAARGAGWRDLIAGWALPSSDKRWNGDAQHIGSFILDCWDRWER